MKFELKKVNDLPVVIISNFYTKKELETIMNFCISTNPYSWFQDPNKNGGAKDDSGKDLKSSYAVCIDEWYTNIGRNFCPIFKLNRKLWDKKVTQKLEQFHVYFETINSSTKDTTFLNYYEDSNFYDFHHDSAILTTLTFFYKEPKKFEGGELLIGKDLTIDCKNNTMVLFPSILKHRVEEVKMLTKEKLYGRFSMTQFLNYA